MDDYLIFREYRNVDGQEIAIEGYYTVGGRNHFSGYVLFVKKVKRENGLIIHTLSFSKKDSYGELLVECKRKSKKKADEALAMITEEKINFMINKLMSYDD